MSAGLIQLVAKGLQSTYLFTKPEITYFKTVYKRHTNFALETLIQPINNLSFGQKITTIINKVGDLLANMYLCIEIPKVEVTQGYFAWVKRLGHAIIKNIELTIGGVRFDKQYDIVFDILWELNRENDHEVGYSKMIGNVPELTSFNNMNKDCYTLYIPLQFWFNKLYCSSFPINFINYNQMYITIALQNLEELVVRSKDFCVPNLKINKIYFMSTYVFLDNCERTKFAMNGLDYLIEQIQANNNYDIITDSYVGFDISNFQYSVKELYWTSRNGNYINGKPFIYYADSFVDDTMDEYYNRYANAGKFKPWDLVEASKIIVLNSVSINNNPDNGGDWQLVLPNENKLVGTFYVINNSNSNVYVNPTSLKVCDYGITDKIKTTIIIDFYDKIKIKYLETHLTIKDISISTQDMIDTRVSDATDVILYQFSNYGLYIDGSGKMIKSCGITFNGVERVMKLTGNYFNYLQPISYHDCVPKNGIMSYSFAIYPSHFEPSGSANFSKLDKVELQVWFGGNKSKYNSNSICDDKDITNNYCFLNYNLDCNKFYVYALNNNIMRVFRGFCGIQCE